jgi:hypothetical protein
MSGGPPAEVLAALRSFVLELHIVGVDCGVASAAYFSDGVAASEDPDVIVGAVNAAGKTDGPAFRPTAANQQRRGNGNAYRRFRRQFNNFDLKSARLNAHTRRSARQLAAAKKDATAESLRSAELELKQYAKHSPSSSVFLAYWRAARAHRDVLFEFYVVQQRGREKAYYSLLDRQRVLAAELQKISTLFNADSGIVFAVGSWRPAPGLHYRGHAPTISAKLRKKLREMRGVFVIVAGMVDHAFLPFLPRAHVQEWLLEAKALVHRQARFSQVNPRTWYSPLRKQAVQLPPSVATR